MFKSRQKKYWLLTKEGLRSLVVIFFVLGVVFYFGKSKIEAIDCQINQTPCPAEIEKEWEDLLGQNFFLARPKQKIGEMKASHPHWEKIEIKKIPLNKILVEITTRQPVACLLVGDKTFLLDQEAVVVKEVEANPGLPEIETEKFHQEEVKKALAAIALVSQQSLPFNRLKIISLEELLLFLPEIEVFLPTEAMAEKIASLQVIVSRAKIEGKIPVKIDLRYKKPVITFLNGPN